MASFPLGGNLITSFLQFKLLTEKTSRGYVTEIYFGLGGHDSLSVRRYSIIDIGAEGLFLFMVRDRSLWEAGSEKRLGQVLGKSGEGTRVWAVSGTNVEIKEPSPI